MSTLSPPAPRRHMHTRRIHCEGFQRDDGLWDIEASIVDTKTYEVEEPYRGLRAPGLHVHDMQVRLTLDDEMVVRAIEVATLEAPYAPCYTVAPSFQGLVGAKIGGGWRRAVNEAVGGTKGCTHIKELLFPMATVAYQTLGSWPKRRKAGAPRQVQVETDPEAAAKRPYFLDGCRAWATDGPVVERLDPLHFRKSSRDAA